LNALLVCGIRLGESLNKQQDNKRALDTAQGPNMSCLLRKVADVTKNQQTTVTQFGENKRLHLDSSKQNYYIISL